MKGLFVGVAVCVACVGGVWALTANELMMRSVFSPKFEAVRRRTFEQTKSYNQGMVQELQNMQFEYVRATDEQKATLASIILHRAADFNEDEMPADLRAFVRALRSER